MITLPMARKIAADCTANVTYSMGLSEDPPPSLRDYSLHELVTANHLVANHRRTKNEDGTESFQVTCDDRVIAALYTAYNYEAESGRTAQPIVIVGHKALICIRVEPQIARDT